MLNLNVTLKGVQNDKNNINSINTYQNIIVLDVYGIELS